MLQENVSYLFIIRIVHGVQKSIKALKKIKKDKIIIIKIVIIIIVMIMQQTLKRYTKNI